MGTTSPNHEKAVTYCQEKINWYKDAANRARKGCHVMEIGAIVLGGAVPVVLLVGGVHVAIPAGLSAAAAMLVAINTTLRWRPNWARYAQTAGALEAEKMLFEMRAGEQYGDDVDVEEAVDRFVQRITQIILNETTEWRTLAVQPTRPGGDK